MNKKQNLLAIALSASFVLAGANVAEASEQSQSTNYSEVQNQNTDNVAKETAIEAQANTQNADAQENPENNTNPTEESSSKKETLDDFINNEGIESLFDVEKINADAKEKLDADAEEKLEEALAKASQAQGAEAPANAAETDTPVQTSKDVNYAEDEAKIKDFNENERYRESDLPPEREDEYGNLIGGPTHSSSEPSMPTKDGFSYNTLEPSATSPDKTKWGIEMEFDKEKGQRTYTDFSFTNSGLLANYLEGGDDNNPKIVPSLEENKKLSEKGDFKDTTHQADSEIKITSSRLQRNLNLTATEEDLKHINNIANKNTTMAWEGKYTKDPTDQSIRATQGENANFTFTVNPWPNENDKLALIKLNGSHDKKEFVQGQEITTNVQVENLDDSARERLVGQVYNPITGEVVEGAKAYINDEGKVVVKMPNGAVNEDGSINKDSIFYKDPKYAGIQNLEVKFFARPRTRAEFEKIAGDNYGTYTETGAGLETIKHKGKDVVIDKQGIDRYDHYNLIGGFKLNLDDTRYYDQGFVNKDDNRTENHTFNDVEAGKGYEIKGIDEALKDIVDIKGNYPKTSEEMQEAVKNGQASAEIDQEFITSQNDKLNPKDRWTVKSTKDGDPSNFTITPPKTAKPGDHFSFPVKYTYTNGSTDIHWFHFVVQETENPESDVPSYNAKAGFEGTKLSSSPKFEESGEGKAEPTDYILEETTFTDEKGNTWTVDIDEDGNVTTTVPEGNIDGGESIEVPVKVEYTDDKGQKKYEYKTVQFFAIPKEDQPELPEYEQVVTKVYTNDIPFNTTVEYDDTIPAGVVKKTEGVVGKTQTTFKQVVRNGKKGIIDENGNFIEDKESVETTTLIEKKDAVIKIGTKPVTTEVDIPRDTEYVIDYDKDPDSEPETVEEGSDGTWEIKTTRDPKTGEISITKTKKTEPVNRIVKIGAKTKGTLVDEDEIPFKYDIQFDPDFYKNYPNAKDNYYIVTEGKAGSNKKTWTIVNSEKVGDPKIEKIDPVNAVIKVGQKDYTGVVTHTEKIETPFEVEYRYSDELEAGQTKVEQEGKNGSYDLVYSQNIKNGDADGEATTEKKNEVTAQNKIVLIGTKPIVDKVEKGYNTEYIYDDTLDAGKIEEKTPGKNGQTTITHYYDKDKKEIVTEETTEDPTNRVVRIGIKPIETEEPIPHNTKYKYNPELKAGEIKKIKDGTPGKVIVTTTFNKDTGKLETKVTRIEPTDAVYEYGSKTEGKVTVESDIPFEVEIIEDDTMDAGTHEVVQEGEVGKKETTIVIENSEEKSRSDKVTKEAKKKIIKVGTKPNENMCPIPGEDPKPETPGEDDPTDPEKPGEEDPKDPETPGEEDPTDPETPGEEDPKDPETPDKPGDKDPETPEEPSTPDKPEEPEKPGTPDKPEEPGERPEIPERPENPENPEVPETTEKPQAPNEERPETPETPETPDVKEEPESPEKPNMPNTVAKKSTNPKTGIGSIAPIFTSMGISIAGLLATKKKKEDEE